MCRGNHISLLRRFGVAGGATSRPALMLLPLLACLAAGPLTGALGGEPLSNPDRESLLLNVNDLTTPSAAPGTTQSPTYAPDGTTQPPSAVPAEAAGTSGRRPGGREGGSEEEKASSDIDATTTTTAAAAAATATATATTTAQPSDDSTEPPADSGETTTAATVAANGDDAVTPTAAPDDAASTTTDDGPTTAASTAAADEHPTTVATEEARETTPVPSGDGDSPTTTPGDAPTTTPGDDPTTTPGDDPTTTPGGQDPTPAATESPATEPVPTTPPAEATSTELPVRLVSGEALPPGQPTLSRHRADPGLAPSETKPSRGRTGVPDPEMLDNPSKPRKGAPPSDEPVVTPLPPAFSGGLSVTEGTPVTGSVTANQATPSSGGAGFFGDSGGADFFGQDTLTGSSPTEKTGAQDGQPAPKEDPQKGKTTTRPKPVEAKDEAGGGSDGGTRGSAIAGVVILVLLFVVIGFFVFRKVRETWYRRHYRKMDFLVDGMYNL